jgi:hypothetical protein
MNIVPNPLKRKLEAQEHYDHTPSEVSSNDPEQPVTIRTTLPVVGWVQEKNPLSISMEFQMTIRSRIEQLTVRQASMLLMVLNCRALAHGVDITLYLSQEFLFTLLVKSGQRPEEVRDEKVRQSVMLAELILSYIRGNWLTFTESEKLPPEIIEKILSTGWIPSNQTLGSWKAYWQPEKFLEFRIVPLETLMKRSGNSEPYSSYCKGYGQDGHRSRVSKTRYSPELDGSTIEPEPPRIPLEDLETFVDILNAIEASRAKQKQK